MDVEDITPGQPFARTIDDTIAGCEIVLIVIGPKWAAIVRQRAQDKQYDYVCHEIEAALARPITIVPVLVGGATASELAGLPEPLSKLSQYEAAELRDSSFSDDCARLTKSLKLQPVSGNEAGARRVSPRRWILALGTLGAIAILLGGSAWLGIGPLGEYRARRAAVDQMFATAKTQAERGEYEPAFRTYRELLKTDPRNRLALDRQVDAAMAWIDDFHVIAPEGDGSEKLAATRLDEIMPVLDAGLARASGQQSRSADIMAHLGWAHWLNQKLAQREFGPAAERDLREALRIDPSNVFANGMLGNWLMQNGGREDEALAHFRTAVDTKKARPLVRGLELGVLVYPNDAQTRIALIRTADEMRRNGEPIDEVDRRRILSAYDSTVNSSEEVSQTLSAVPPSDAWATYLWLDPPPQGDPKKDSRRYQRDFIHASIVELGGNREEALQMFQRLRDDLKQKGYYGSLLASAERAVTRLSTR